MLCIVIEDKFYDTEEEAINASIIRDIENEPKVFREVIGCKWLDSTILDDNPSIRVICDDNGLIDESKKPTIVNFRDGKIVRTLDGTTIIARVRNYCGFADFCDLTDDDLEEICQHIEVKQHAISGKFRIMYIGDRFE